MHLIPTGLNTLPIWLKPGYAYICHWTGVTIGLINALMHVWQQTNAD